MREGLTINEAAETTGWSPRMLRYIESAGLIDLPRTPSGYRLFGPGELQRLRTLRELLARFDCALSDVAFARRLAADPDLRASLDTWFEERPQRPEGVDTSDWLHWEQEKHERLLALDRAIAPARASPRPRALPPHERRTLSHDCYRDRHQAGLQGRRHLAGRLRPQGDHTGRARDARPDGDARGVRREQAARGRAHHGLAAHDRADGGADRDAGGAGRRGALGLVQHLLHPGSRRGRDRGGGDPRVRLEGRDARGVLVVHRAGTQLARCGRPQHDPRRRRRRHDARAQGHRVREGRRGPRSRGRRVRGVPRLPLAAAAHTGRGPAALDAYRRGHPGRDRGDHHRCPSPLRDVPAGHAAVPGDQRQRLGHEVEVRQPLRLSPLADRRHQPRHRRDDRRQVRPDPGLRRRRQGLRPVAARPGRPRARVRDRPHLRAAGLHGRLPGRSPRRRGGRDRHLRHRHGQQGHHHRRPHGEP